MVKLKMRMLFFLVPILIISMCIEIYAVPVNAKRILLIVMDGARYDYCTPETMPNLFAFMKEGKIFKNAYSPSSWTLPSHASLFTGLYPQQHGAFRLPTQSKNRENEQFMEEINIDDISIPQEALTVADILKNAGYQTIGVFGNPCYGYPIFNLSKGFDVWVNVVEKKLKQIGKENRGFYSFDYKYKGEFFTVIPNASEVALEVEKVLEMSKKEEHTFLFVNFEDPIATPLYFPPETREKIKRNYKKHLRASMKRIDDVLPPILSYFREGLVIVTSDHGQGDGTKFKPTEHYTSLHPFQTHVPLLINNIRPMKFDGNRQIDLTRIIEIILESAELHYPGENVFFHPGPPYAFGHLDSNPKYLIGEQAHFSIYSQKGTLIARRFSDFLFKMFYYNQDGKGKIAELLPTEHILSEAVYPFTKLERVYSGTDRYQKLDEQNIEMLKSLGYIQ